MIDTRLPLVDLHRHLDGNITPDLILTLAERNNNALAQRSLEEISAMTQIQDKTSDLLAFLEKLDVGVSVLETLDDCYLVGYENMRNAMASGIDYVELRFSPYYMAMNHSLPMSGVVEAVCDGVNAGSKAFGVGANLIGILSRTFGKDTCMHELTALLEHKSHLRALDLAGDELNFPAPEFIEHFKLGRDAGWAITVHAGEADGPQSIWNAITLLGATRIGHGVAAVRDEDLMRHMAENKIAVESCPTSNYQTATVQDIAGHPIKTFLEQGILVTLNTDDPAVSNIDLKHEYQVAADIIGMSQTQLAQLQKNGVSAAFLSDTEKQALFDNKA